VIDYNNEPINYCKDKQAGIKKLFFSKSKDWAHEKEYRMSFLKKAGLYEFNKKFLKTICFGIKTPEEEKRNIINLTIEQGYSHLEFNQAYKDKLELKYKLFEHS